MTVDKQRKEIILNYVKTLKVGDTLTKDQMRVYIQALNDFKNYVVTEFIDISLDIYSHFILSEIPIDKFPNAKISKIKNRQHSEALRSRIESIKLTNIYYSKYKKSNWYPPVIFDNMRDKLLDGNHRVMTCRKLGHKSIMGFTGVVDHEYDDIKQHHNMERLKKIHSTVLKLRYIKPTS